jgi:L-ascorbate peroxidase
MEPMSIYVQPYAAYASPIIALLKDAMSRLTVLLAILWKRLKPTIDEMSQVTTADILTHFQAVARRIDTFFRVAWIGLAPVIDWLKEITAADFFEFMIILAITVTGLRMTSKYFVSGKNKRAKMILSLSQCKADLKREMTRMKCSPIMLRLAWSDCATYDKNARFWPECGGATGAIRFQPEVRHENNAGLFKAIKLLEPVKKRHPDVSWSDMIQMAGVLSVEITGGPIIKIRYGRIDAPNFHEERNFHSYPVQDSMGGAGGKKGRGPKVLHHHKNNTTSEGGCPFIAHHADRLPKATGPYPDGAAVPSVHIRNVFYRMGFDNKEIVALCGAHTIGRAFADRSGVTEHLSGYRGATDYTQATSIARDDGEPGIGMPGGCSWTKNWLTFDNSYYRNAFAGSDKSVYTANLASVSENEQQNDHKNQLFSAISNPMRMTTNPKARTPVNLNQLLRKRDPQLLWLPTDNALETDPELKSFFFTYAASQQAWFQDYAAAHKKMCVMGSRWELVDVYL